jgi:GNAT superfamily N-acetyltransferase
MLGAVIALREATALDEADVAGLAELLVAVVESGAAVGFLAPLGMDEAAAYWRAVPAPGVTTLVAEDDAGRIVGTAQLHCSTRTNGLHRAEVAKVMVHPSMRRRGIARRLMLGLEAVARREGRWLLVLDTREGDPSNALYHDLGYVVAGRIPRYARSSDGPMHATILYYKELEGAHD